MADGMKRTGPLCEDCGERLAAAIVPVFCQHCGRDEPMDLCGSCALSALEYPGVEGSTDADVRQAIEDVGR